MSLPIVTLPLTSGVWMSKARNGEIAHYIVDGAPACSRIVLSDGRPALAPFKDTFVPFRMRDHLCMYCRRLSPKVCVCRGCTLVHRHRTPSP